ncbi:MAG: hypothetical protein K0S30_359 [Clostridia bacterium]|jgi:hypothetical protein|nr:hypothetical protein [Clostridia bacterium]
MEDIIKQIIQIDSVALNTKQKNEEEVQLRKQEYEEEIKQYKEDKLVRAKKKADELYSQIIENALTEAQFQEEKSKKMALSIQNRYLQSENILLDKIFKELFLVE